MNPVDIICIILTLLLVALAIRGIAAKKKKAETSCKCDGCGHDHGCHDTPRGDNQAG